VVNAAQSGGQLFGGGYADHSLSDWLLGISPQANRH